MAENCPFFRKLGAEWCDWPSLAASGTSFRGFGNPGLRLKNGGFQRFTLQGAFPGRAFCVGLGRRQSVHCEFVDEHCHGNAVWVGVFEGFENRCHAEREGVKCEEFLDLGFDGKVCCGVSGVSHHELGCAFGVFGNPSSCAGWGFTEGD